MLKENKLTILPSLICMDLCNLEAEVKKLEKNGYDMLHVDILDGYFSPSMPIGLDTVRQLRKKTDMDFDVHIMTKDNEFFVKELIDIGVQRIAFHSETTLHVDHLLKLIQANNIVPGLAFNPATNTSVLEYVSEYCEYVLLMLINPGFAGQKGEKQVPYYLRKVKDFRDYFRKNHSNMEIEVDGRISFDNIPELAQAGARSFVAGTSTLFSKADVFENNHQRLTNLIRQEESRLESNY